MIRSDHRLIHIWKLELRSTLRMPEESWSTNLGLLPIYISKCAGNNLHMYLVLTPILYKSAPPLELAVHPCKPRADSNIYGSLTNQNGTLPTRISFSAGPKLRRLVLLTEFCCEVAAAAIPMHSFHLDFIASVMLSDRCIMLDIWVHDSRVARLHLYVRKPVQEEVDEGHDRYLNSPNHVPRL